MTQDPYRRVTITEKPDGTPCITLKVMTRVNKDALYANMPSMRDPTKRGKGWKTPTDDGDWKPKWRPRRKPLRIELKAIKVATKNYLREKAERELDRRLTVSDIIKRDDKGQVVWTQELKDMLIEHLSNGGTVQAFAKRLGTTRYVVDVLLRTEEMRPLAEAAKRRGADALMEEALSIASTPMMVQTRIERFMPSKGGEFYEDVDLDGGVKLAECMVKTEDNVHARKLAYQARVHLASKLAPDKYGEKPEVRETDSMAERIIKARARLRKG